MRLTVLGSSDAFNSSGRSHSSYLLEGEGTGSILVDVGATTVSALRRTGRNLLEVSGIAITHLHGDHVGGYPFLVIDGMFNEVRRAPLSIVGPIGTAAKLDVVLRVAYGPLADYARPYETSVREVEPAQSTELAGFRIEAFAADHMDPPDVPLCLRISANGKTVAFSGDTAVCPGLFAAADGADLLVAECTALAPPAGRHCTWQDWRTLLDRTSATPIGAERVLLTHLGASVRAEARGLVEEAAALPGSPTLEFAEDGMVVVP